MQVFICDKSPYQICEQMKLDRRRMNKQVIEATQIISTIEGLSKSWKNHPICLMYREHRDWLEFYKNCMDCYLKGLYEYAKYWSYRADGIIPRFITDDMVTQHRRRLYTKSPELYPQFAEYGKSEENWYFVDGKLLKYINGKQVK